MWDESGEAPGLSVSPRACTLTGVCLVPQRDLAQVSACGLYGFPCLLIS